jgi:hypothetical protein
MAEIVLTDARIEIDANVVSDHGNQVSITYEAETQDDTTFGNTTRSNKGGLKNWQMELNFVQEFSAELDAILFPLVGTDFIIKVRPASGAIGASNPEYSARGILTNYAPIGGSVGDLAAAPITILPAKGSVAGSHVLARAVA